MVEGLHREGLSEKVTERERTEGGKGKELC
jgi:hypothetical protein